jgi:hypothetical protein
MNREFEMCGRLAIARHPNIVETKGYWYCDETLTTRKINLMMEFVPQTLRSILAYLKDHQMRIKATRAGEYMFQVAAAASPLRLPLPSATLALHRTTPVNLRQWRLLGRSWAAPSSTSRRRV